MSMRGARSLPFLFVAACSAPETVCPKAPSPVAVKAPSPEARPVGFPRSPKDVASPLFEPVPVPRTLMFDPVVFRKKLAEDNHAPLREETKGNLTTWVLLPAFSGKPTSPSRLLESRDQASISANNFMARYGEVLAVGKLDRFVEEPLDPKTDGALAHRWRIANDHPPKDSGCASIVVTLDFVDPSTVPVPTRVSRECVPRLPAVPSYASRTLPRTGKFSDVLFECKAAGHGHGTFVDRYGDMYAGSPEVNAFEATYVGTLPPEDVEGALLDVATVREALLAEPPPYRLPPGGPIPGSLPPYCVAFWPLSVGNVVTVGLTFFEEWGRAQAPVVRLREWLEAHKMLR